jgi:hypothetical protein
MKAETDTAGVNSLQGKSSSRALEAPRFDRAAATNTLVSNTTRIGMRSYPAGRVSARMPQTRIETPGSRGTVGQFADCRMFRADC